MARTSKHSPDERLYRKRLAARLRQRRCRERKKLAMLSMKAAEGKDSKSVEAPKAVVLKKVYVSSAPAPTGPPPPHPKYRVMHYPVHSVFRGCAPYGPPVYHPTHMPPPPHYVHPHPPSHVVPYYPPPPHYVHHGPPPTAPVPVSNAERRDSMPRTVSRSSSDGGSVSSASTHGSLPKMVTTVPNQKPKKSKNLGTEEKNAVDAILSLKDSDNEDDNSTIVSEATLPSTNLNQAFNQVSVVEVHAI